jgi:hypothetical protein
MKLNSFPDQMKSEINKEKLTDKERIEQQINF